MNYLICIACLFIPSNDARFLPHQTPELFNIDLQDQCAGPLACTWPLPGDVQRPYRLFLLSRDTGLIRVAVPGASDTLLLVKLGSPNSVTILRSVRPAF